MKECPICHINMRETPKYGVLLDICPQCKGVWLDRGELQKVISLARDFEDEHDDLYHHYQRNYEHHKHREHEHKYHDHYHNYDRQYRHKKKKHSLLRLMEEIFD